MGTGLEDREWLGVSLGQSGLMKIDDKVMTVIEVAEYLNVHPSTIYRLLRRKVIPAFRVGSVWRFNRESIDTWRTSRENR